MLILPPWHVSTASPLESYTLWTVLFLAASQWLALVAGLPGSSEDLSEDFAKVERLSEQGCHVASAAGLQR